MNKTNDWATEAFIKALQRGHKVPKGLKEKIEKVFRPVMKPSKKKTDSTPTKES